MLVTSFVKGDVAHDRTEMTEPNSLFLLNWNGRFGHRSPTRYARGGDRACGKAGGRFILPWRMLSCDREYGHLGSRSRCRTESCFFLSEEDFIASPALLSARWVAVHALQINRPFFFLSVRVSGSDEGTKSSAQLIEGVPPLGPRLNFLDVWSQRSAKQNEKENTNRQHIH